MTTTRDQPATTQATRTGIIDCDVHPMPRGEYLCGREGEILRCPWHGWEFDIMNGRSICNSHRIRVRTYEVTVEADEDPSVEAYPVTIEDGLIVLHV